PRLDEPFEGVAAGDSVRVLAGVAAAPLPLRVRLDRGRAERAVLAILRAEQTLGLQRGLDDLHRHGRARGGAALLPAGVLLRGLDQLRKVDRRLDPTGVAALLQVVAVEPVVRRGDRPLPVEPTDVEIPARPADDVRLLAALQPPQERGHLGRVDVPVLGRRRRLRPAAAGPSGRGVLRPEDHDQVGQLPHQPVDAVAGRRAGVRGVALDGLDFAAAEVLLDEEHVLRAVGLAGPLHQADVARPRLTGPVAPGRVADDLLAVTAVPCVVDQVGAPGGCGVYLALTGFCP